MTFPYEDYLRNEKLPLLWCPGCGDGIVLKAIIRAIHKLGWKKDDIAMVSGIGCSGRTPGYVDCNTLDRKSTRLNSSHIPLSRMPSSA